MSVSPRTERSAASQDRGVCPPVWSAAVLVPGPAAGAGAAVAGCGAAAATGGAADVGTGGAGGNMAGAGGWESVSGAGRAHISETKPEHVR